MQFATFKSGTSGYLCFFDGVGFLQKRRYKLNGNGNYHGYLVRGSPTNFSGFNSDCIACVVSSGGVTSVKTFAISKMTMTLNTTLKPCTMPSFERLMIHQLQMAFSLEKNSAFMMNIKTKNQNIRFTEPMAVEKRKL